MKHRVLKGRTLHRQRGQGMSEYIIITALIAVAAIGVFALFGNVLQNQTAGMAQEMAGGDGTGNISKAQSRANDANAQAESVEGLNNYAGNNDTGGDGGSGE